MAIETGADVLAALADAEAVTVRRINFVPDGSVHLRWDGAALHIVAPHIILKADQAVHLIAAQIDAAARVSARIDGGGRVEIHADAVTRIDSGGVGVTYLPDCSATPGLTVARHLV